MLRVIGVAATSLLAADLVLFVMYLLVALAGPLEDQWVTPDRWSWWLVVGLLAFGLAASVAVGALSVAPVTGSPVARSVGAELVAILLPAGLWVVAYLLLPVVTESAMPVWVRRVAPAEALQGLALCMLLPVSPCAAYACQVWRRTHRWWAAVGVVAGAPLQVLAVGAAVSSRRLVGDIGAYAATLLSLLVWPAVTVALARWASRRKSAEAEGS
jgi:hypothetical protein